MRAAAHRTDSRPRRRTAAVLPVPRATLRRQLKAEAATRLERPTIEPEQLERLTAYGIMLARWNRAYNLISPHTVSEIGPRHILDSLLLAPLLPAPPCRLLDVGTGAGLPGLPLAITHPQIRVTLLDRNHKKTRFSRQVALELELANVTVVTEDMAHYQDAPFDCITARAVGPASDLVRDCTHLCAPDGRMVLPQGPESGDTLDLDGWSTQVEHLSGRSILVLQRTRG